MFSKKRQLRRELKRLERSRCNLRCSKIDDELDRDQLAPGTSYREGLSRDIQRIELELELVDAQIQEKRRELAAI